jgi:hypothetical protein
MTLQALLFIALGVIVLLPIIPAYLLFKALPTSADVSGVLQGMHVKLGGAFGGYFVLVVLILTQLPQIKEFMKEPSKETKTAAPPAAQEVWRVEGQVVDEQGDAIQPLGPSDVQLMPQSLDLGRNGNFVATVNASLLPSGHGRSYPLLNVSHDGYNTRTVRLDPGPNQDQETRDETGQRIVLHPVKLKKLSLPAYAAAGAPPAPVAHPNY